MSEPEARGPEDHDAPLEWRAPSNDQVPGFVPVARTTSPQVSISFLMNSANWMGEPGAGMPARRSISRTTAGSCSSAFTSRFTLATISSGVRAGAARSEEHTSELQSRENLVCRLL